MLGRSSKTAVVESTGSRAADAAVETAQELAAKALVAAREAQRVATPIIRNAAERSAPVLRSAAERSAETLSHAAERAAVVLADTAEKLAESGEEHAATATEVARIKLANASESLAKAVRPKKSHKLRRALTAVLLLGGIVALVRSPLKSKLADRIFGAPPEFDDDEPESITLPTTPESSAGDLAEEEAPTPPASQESGEANGVASASGVSHGDNQAS